jgi:hypothetical protein
MKRRRALIISAVVCVAVGTFAVPASAQRPAGPRPAAPSGAALLAAGCDGSAGEEGEFICRTASDETNIPILAPPIDSDLRQWCAVATPQIWWSTRTGLCKRERAFLTIIDRIRLPGGGTRERFVAELEIMETLITSTAVDSDTYRLRLEVQELARKGSGEDVTVSGFFVCGGGCTIQTAFFTHAPIASSNAASGEAVIANHVLGPGDVQSARPSINYSFHTPGVPSRRPANAFVTSPDVRCDDASPERPGVIGCVQPNWAGTYHLSSAAFPEVAHHVRRAQASGLPGADEPLHRLSNRSFQDNNRAIACPRSRTPSDDPPPFGPSCDEYPFASTWQGAWVSQQAGGRGRTFDGCGLDHSLPRLTGPGWSACMVPFRQNGRAGSDLAKFYRDNRIIDGDPFFVQVD